jgi:hypothetical protein
VAENEFYKAPQQPGGSVVASWDTDAVHLLKD